MTCGQASQSRRHPPVSKFLFFFRASLAVCGAKLVEHLGSFSMALESAFWAFVFGSGFAAGRSLGERVRVWFVFSEM